MAGSRQSGAFVVIPVYNEGPGLGALLQQVMVQVPAPRVVVVDDGSTPPVGRAAVAPAHLLRHAINLGKGMALKTGCEFALRQGAQAIVLMDGDGQHDPADIPRLLEALDEVDVAFTARAMDWEAPWVRLAGNRLLNRCARGLFGLDLRDAWCGYRAFRAEAWERVAWTAPDYAADVEMALRARQHGLCWREVPIGAIYHDPYKGVSVLDGLRLLLRLLAWRFTL